MLLVVVALPAALAPRVYLLAARGMNKRKAALSFHALCSLSSTQMCKSMYTHKDNRILLCDTHMKHMKWDRGIGGVVCGHSLVLRLDY